VENVKKEKKSVDVTIVGVVVMRSRHQHIRGRRR
jgi:hypothetical protein